jgi:hypothetical protein
MKMNRDRRRTWILTVGVALMLIALFSYVATLDESDPEAIPEATETLDGSVP